MTRRKQFNPRHARSQQNATYETLEAATDGKISAKMFGAIFTGQSGVTLDNLDSFLNALGYQVVKNGSVPIPPKQYTAMVEAIKKLGELLVALDRKGIDLQDLDDAQCERVD